LNQCFPLKWPNCSAFFAALFHVDNQAHNFLFFRVNKYEMANSIAFRYTSSLMGKMTHRGYDRSNNLRAPRVDNTAIIAYDFSIYSERLLSPAEVESKMKAVAERVLPDFAPDGGNETTSAWWAWGDDGTSIFSSGRPPQPVEVSADTVDPRAAWVRRLPGRLQPSSHFFKGVN